MVPVKRKVLAIVVGAVYVYGVYGLTGTNGALTCWGCGETQ